MYCTRYLHVRVNVHVIVQNIAADGTTDITFTVQRGEMEKAADILENTAKELNAREVLKDDKIAKVSIVGVGMRSHAGVASQMFEALADDNINIHNALI